MEIYFINKFDSINCGYNLTKGGNGIVGFNHTTETKQKISECSKNISIETRQKISESGKGRIVSEETRQKISKGNKGNIISEEGRKNMSDAHKGKKYTEEEKQKFSNAAKNLKKKVYQYTKDNVFITEFESTVDAAKLLKLDNSSISKCCRGVAKSCGGFLFRYEKI